MAIRVVCEQLTSQQYLHYSFYFPYKRPFELLIKFILSATRGLTNRRPKLKNIGFLLVTVLCSIEMWSSKMMLYLQSLGDTDICGTKISDGQKVS